MKTQSEVIDGITYTTRTMPATQGLMILPKLVNLVGENGLTLLMATSEDERASLMENKEVVAALITSIADRASDGGLLVLKELLELTTCNKIKIGDNEVEGSVLENFDDHFAGRYVHLITVAIWVGRVSFGQP